MAHKGQSKILDTLFGTIDPAIMSQKVQEKLAVFHNRYEEVTEIILSPGEREIIDKKITALNERYRDGCEKYEADMSDYIHEIMPHPEKERDCSLA